MRPARCPGLSQELFAWQSGNGGVLCGEHEAFEVGQRAVGFEDTETIQTERWMELVAFKLVWHNFNKSSFALPGRQLAIAQVARIAAARAAIARV